MKHCWISYDFIDYFLERLYENVTLQELWKTSKTDALKKAEHECANKGNLFSTGHNNLAIS
jgi:hypothetical protein